MIHTIDTLSIGLYGEIDRTENLSLFKRWFNPLPVRFFNLQQLISKIGEGLNTDADKLLTYEAGKLLMYNRILLLESLYLAIYNLIVVKPENDQWKLTKKTNNKLYEYLAKVKEITAIEIKDLEGLTRLNKEIIRIKDKFQEKYKKPLHKGNPIPFTKYAYSIFMLAEMPYNPETKMSEFLQLVSIANDKTKQLEQLKSKHG